MLRGSSSVATRPCKKARMRRAVCWSSLPKSRTAARSISTFQAIAFHHFFKRYGLRLPGSNVDQPVLGKVQVLKIVQVLPDGLNHVEGLAAPGEVGQPLFRR